MRLSLTATTLVLLTLFPLGCSRKPEHRIGVAATTTLIGSNVSEVGGPAFAPSVVAPAGICPGQIDLRPADLAGMNESQLLLNHGWEAWYAEVGKSLSTPGPRRVTLRTQGDWLVPDIHKQAADELSVLLAEVAPSEADSLQARNRRYRLMVDSVAGSARALLTGKSLPPVIASTHQAPLLQWLGFTVVATYGRAGDFTPQELTRLSRVALDSVVGLVMDNIQSGPETGLELSRALSIRHAALSNFPDPDGPYSQVLTDNAERLSQALSD